MANLRPIPSPDARRDLRLESARAVRERVAPGLSRAGFYELAAQKLIPSYRVGTRLLFDAVEVADALRGFRRE